MEYRHISVKIVDGVIVVHFKNLAMAVYSEDMIQEIGNECSAATSLSTYPALPRFSWLQSIIVNDQGD